MDERRERGFEEHTVRRRTMNQDCRRAAMRRRLTGLAAAAWLSFSVVPLNAASDLAVPGGMQATMAVRILEYDRGLKSWARAAVTVGIVARRAASAADFRDALSGRDAQGVPIRVTEHAYEGAPALQAWIDRSGVRLLYVSPDVGSDAAAVLATGSGRRLPTLVATRAQFQDGATLGLVVRDGKPHILVNLPSARAAGMDLDPKLLQLSEVVR